MDVKFSGINYWLCWNGLEGGKYLGPREISWFAWLRNQSTTFDFSLLIEYFEISNTFDKVLTLTPITRMSCEDGLVLWALQTSKFCWISLIVCLFFHAGPREEGVMYSLPIHSLAFFLLRMRWNGEIRKIPLSQK